MKYETKMKFDKHIISEEYVVDDKAYRAELHIQSLGFIAGVAGYDACSVEVLLYENRAEYPIGRVGIDFPMIMRLDGDNPKRMLAPCPRRGFPWNTPPRRKFTSYAEREIGRVVTTCIRQKESFSTLAFSLSSISVSVGNQNAKTRGDFFTFVDGSLSMLCYRIADRIQDLC